MCTDGITRLLNYAEEARFIAENQGMDQLKSWLQQLDRREAIPFLLLDEQGRDLLDRPVSAPPGTTLSARLEATAAF